MSYTHNAADVTAQMTGNNAPSPNVVVEDSYFGGYNYSGWRAFDHGTSYYWNSDGTAFPHWVYFDSGSALYAVNKYSIYIDFDAYYPKTWKFQGSDDASTWTDLDSRTDETSWTAGVVREFTFSNSTSYRYYRLYCTEGAHSVYLIITQIEMFAATTTTVTAVPFSSSASLSGQYQLGLSVDPLAAAGSLSMAGLYAGDYITAEFFASASALSASPEMDVLAGVLAGAGSLSIRPALLIPSADLGAAGGLVLSGVFWGLSVDVSGVPLSAASALASVLELDLQVPLLAAAGGIAASVELIISCPPGSAATGLVSGIPVVFADLDYRITFTCLLTGEADDETDLTLPISSFQGRFRSGDPSYLSCVVPGLDYAADIADRPNGEIRVYMVKTYRSGNVVSECISAVDLEDLRIDEGGDSQSISLSGHRTITSTPKTVGLDGTSYRNVINGLRRYRCAPDLYLRPGDTVEIDGESMTADEISWTVNADYSSMEIAETS